MSGYAPGICMVHLGHRTVVAIGSSNGVEILDPETGVLLRKLDTNYPVKDVSVSDQDELQAFGPGGYSSSWTISWLGELVP